MGRFFIPTRDKANVNEQKNIKQDTNDTQTINEQGETIETNIEVKGTIYETIFGQDKTVFNLDTGEVIEETTLKKVLLKELMN